MLVKNGGQSELRFGTFGRRGQRRARLDLGLVQPVLVGLAGDPLYAGVRLLDQQYRLEDVRLLAPVLPRSCAPAGRYLAGSGSGSARTSPRG